MIDPYAREERIAIRMASGILEREAIKLTDRELAQPTRQPDGKEYGKSQLAEAWKILGRGQ